MTTQREMYEHAGLGYTPPKELRVHELKSWPSYFQRDKPWELRKADRDYQVGDYVVLREFENGRYTGFSRVRCIRHIDVSETHGPLFAIAPGHCILTLGLPEVCAERVILSQIAPPVLDWLDPL